MAPIVLVQQFPAFFQKVEKKALFHPVPISTPASSEPSRDSTFSKRLKRKWKKLIPKQNSKNPKNVFFPQLHRANSYFDLRTRERMNHSISLYLGLSVYVCLSVCHYLCLLHSALFPSWNSIYL